MSKYLTPEELKASSDAIRKAHQRNYDKYWKEYMKELKNEVEAIHKIVRFASKQREFNFPCPRCGKWSMDKDPVRNALSRRVDVYICNSCGTAEALEDYTGQPMMLSDWEISKHEEWPLNLATP